MTKPEEFARSIIEDAQYRQSVINRAAAGTLPEELELLIWDVAASRVPAPLPRDISNTPVRRLAFARPAQLPELTGASPTFRTDTV